jgi:hypothetical protein
MHYANDIDCIRPSRLGASARLGRRVDHLAVRRRHKRAAESARRGATLVSERRWSRDDVRMRWDSGTGVCQRLRQIVNDGGPTTADLCSAFDVSSNPAVNDVGSYGS